MLTLEQQGKLLEECQRRLIENEVLLRDIQILLADYGQRIKELEYTAMEMVSIQDFKIGG